MLLGILGNKGIKTKTKEMQEGEITEYGQVTKQWIFTLFKCRGIKNAPTTETYLESSLTSTMEFFGENSWWYLTVNFFHKKASG